MHKCLKRVIAVAATTAIAGGGLLASAGTAFAVTAPAWEPDGNAAAPYGSVVFYDSAGNVLTGGTNLNHLADYVAASTGPDAGATKANLLFALPDPAKATGAWTTAAASASTNFPNATAPAPIQGPGFTYPVVTLGASDANLNNFISTTTTSTTAGYTDVYQVRVKDSGAGGVTSGSHYWESDIKLTRDATTNAITGWTLIYQSTATVVTQTAGPASPQATSSTNTTTPITLTSTNTPGFAGGSVQFFDNGTALGAAIPSTANGVVTTSVTPPPVAAGAAPVTHAYTSQYTPAASSPQAGSTSAAYNYTVTQPNVSTSSFLARSAATDNSGGSSQTFTDTVTPASGGPVTGSVQFFDNGSTTPIAGTVTQTGNNYVLTTTALGTGAHSVVANFTGTSPYLNSTSNAVAFSLGNTTTTLAQSGGTTAYSSQTLTATVSPSAAPGSVAFYDNGSTTPISGTQSNPSPGTYVLTTTALGQGAHSVVATYTPTAGNTNYTGSSSSPVAFTLAAPACPGDPAAYTTGGGTNNCSDAQAVQVTVTPGFLNISTPYTAAKPFVLPNMQINSAGTLLSTSANFPNVAGVAGSTGSDAPLTITSTLAGDPNWTASVTATDLTGVKGTSPAGTNDTISAQNMGLTAWTQLSKSNPASTITFASNPAGNNASGTGFQPGDAGTAGLKGAPKTFASTAGGGNGTVTAYGTLTLNAPTNTINDTYNGTITFSVA